MPKLERAIVAVIRECLGIREGEEVLVVADAATEALGLALRAGAEDVGADAVLAFMTEREENGTEPPASVAAAMRAADAFVAPTSKSLSHTRARKEATEAGVRGATLPGVTEEMLGRLMGGDFEAMRRRSRAVAELLSRGTAAHLTCPRGSDLELDLTGRDALADDGDLREAGAFGNLPCGEGFISPASGSGTVHATSLASVGLPDDPVELVVEDGALVRADGAAGETFFARLDAHGADGRHLAELGVGTNDEATLTGNVLEDEKILGTVHVAFGASAGIGGTVSVPVHLDCVVVDATLDVDGERVLDAGRFVLDGGGPG